MKSLSFLLFLFVLFVFLCEVSIAWNRGKVKNITLRSGWYQPESITTDGKGRIYATLYQPESEGSGRVLEIRGEKLVKVHKLTGTTRGLAGIHYSNEKDGSVLVVDNSAAKIVKWVPSTGKVEDFATIPDVTGKGALFPNDLTQDNNGNVYVTDSLQGIIFKITDAGATVNVWSSASILGANGLGVNGIAFYQNEKYLLVTQTSSNAIYSIPVDYPEDPTFFASIPGPDGIRVDKDDKNIWVVSNAGSEVVVYNPKGKVISVKGDFDGIDDNGVARGLFGPAGLVYDDDTGKWYVVNAGFPGLGYFNQYTYKHTVISILSASTNHPF